MGSQRRTGPAERPAPAERPIAYTQQVPPAPPVSPASPPKPGNATASAPSSHLADARSYEPAPETQTEDAYSPDDPGYGPPDPSWYARRQQERQEQEEEESRWHPAAEELRQARGAFEPLPSQTASADSQTAGPSSAEKLLLAAIGGPGHDQDPVGQIKDLYLAAEGVGDETLERRYEELMDRQRQLIREYFNESGPVVSSIAEGSPVTVSGDRQGSGD